MPRTAPEQRQYSHVTLMIRKQRFSLSGMCPIPIWALCLDFGRAFLTLA
jgi:hypothetical protein